MGFLKECQNLKELILWGCGITGQGVKSLSASGLELETLNLGTDWVTQVTMPLAKGSATSRS